MSEQLPPPPPPADPLPPRQPRQPLWTAFLTPIAVIAGALVVAGAIWFADDGAGDNGGTQVVAAPDGGASDATDGGVTTAPPTLLAAFGGYADQLGIDTTEFEQCLAETERADQINRHLQMGQQLGVTGTPTFFVNNKRIVGAQPTEVFLEVIEKELEGSPTSIEEYSATIQQLAATDPPRFEIVEQVPNVEGATIEGNPDAPVMIAEFSDFQCPFCQRWVQASMEPLREVIGDDVALAFLHFPLTQIHPNAAYASFAAICAGDQDRFWEMHDLLFARQQEWQSLPTN